MKFGFALSALAVLTLCALVSPAAASFTGQTILGPLGPGSVVTGDTLAATDNNDGFGSGGHIYHIWNGPDDVWALNWPGGDLELNMTYDNTHADLDLFLYTPENYSDCWNYSIVNDGLENIPLPAAAPGLYYVVVDSPDLDTAGAYTLSVNPEPASVALLGLLLVARRR
jgi:hypothetical protein